MIEIITQSGRHLGFFPPEQLPEIKQAVDRAYFANAPETDPFFNAIGTYFSLSREQLLARDRSEPCLWPRALLAFLLRRDQMKFMRIGQLLQRDHATIINACRLVQDRLDVEPQARADLAAIEALLASPPCAPTEVA